MAGRPIPDEARDLRALLVVVLDALTLPAGAAGYAHRLESRADLARAAVRGALEDDPAEIGWNVEYLRDRLAKESAEADRLYRYGGDPR